MKVRRRLPLVAAFLLAAIATVIASYGLGLSVTAANFTSEFLSPYTKGHATAGAGTVGNGECIQCHRNIPGRALRGGKTAHEVHLRSFFLAFGRMTSGNVRNGCVTCHTDVNTSNYIRVADVASNTPISYEGDVSYALPFGGDGSSTDTTSKLRRHVNPSFCQRCHGTFRTSIGSHGGTIPVGCLNCHGTNRVEEVWHHDRANDKIGSPNHAHKPVPFVNYIFANGNQPDARCMRCHGSIVLYNVTELNRTNAENATP